MAPNGPRSLSNFTIGTVNVIGLSSATKRDHLSEDFNKLHIDICCIQETKCPDNFDVISGYYRIIGLPSTSHHYGLAFAVASYLEDKLLRYWSVSDILAVIQLSLGRHSTLTIITAYGPTTRTHKMTSTPTCTTSGVKSRSHHQRNTPATTLNSWPVDLSARSSAMQCQSRYQRSTLTCPLARSGIYLKEL